MLWTHMHTAVGLLLLCKFFSWNAGRMEMKKRWPSGLNLHCPCRCSELCSQVPCNGTQLSGILILGEPMFYLASMDTSHLWYTHLHASQALIHRIETTSVKTHPRGACFLTHTKAQFWCSGWVVYPFMQFLGLQQLDMNNCGDFLTFKYRGGSVYLQCFQMTNNWGSSVPNEDSVRTKLSFRKKQSKMQVHFWAAPS